MTNSIPSELVPTRYSRSVGGTTEAAGLRMFVGMTHHPRPTVTRRRALQHALTLSVEER